MKRLHHVCIQTDCYEASKAFYTNTLGFKVIDETKDFHGRAYNTWLEQDGFKIELQTGKKGETLAEVNKVSKGIVHLCFLVENVEEEVEALTAKGCESFSIKEGKPVYKVGKTTLCKFTAPEGTIIEMRDREDIQFNLS